jgi:hypothetical protein
MMTRTGHISRASITSLQVIWPGLVTPESTVAGTHTLTASIEYPAGTFTQVKFSGVASGTVPAGGQLMSDAVTVTIPDGSTFWVRSYWVSDTQILYADNVLTTVFGDGCEFGASGITDKTMSGTVALSLNVGYMPIAIIGTTTKPSLLLLGDSICMGYADSFNGTDPGDKGILARSIGPSFGYINAGCIGELAQGYVTTNAKRTALATYCTHIVTQYGINDLVNSRTAAQLKTDMQSIIALTAKPTYVATLTPKSGSTDTWATTGNQTADATVTAPRVTYNASVRTGLVGAAGFFEIGDAVENVRDTDIWKAGYTGDGLHPNRTGNVAIVSANAIPTATFT